MILEFSFSLMSLSLWGFYFGWKKLGEVSGMLSADSLIIKFLPILVQFTIYRINDED